MSRFQMDHDLNQDIGEKPNASLRIAMRSIYVASSKRLVIFIKSTAGAKSHMWVFELPWTLNRKVLKP